MEKLLGILVPDLLVCNTGFADNWKLKINV